VIVRHRPKYGCRACEGAIVQAPAPERLIKSGIPTEGLVASVVVDKFAWHTPLYRKRRLDDIGFPIDAGGFSGACGNIVCNKDCNICCKALRQFWREVCG